MFVVSDAVSTLLNGLPKRLRPERISGWLPVSVTLLLPRRGPPAPGRGEDFIEWGLLISLVLQKNRNAFPHNGLSVGIPSSHFWARLVPYLKNNDDGEY